MGAALILAAPWLTRAVTTVDRHDAPVCSARARWRSGCTNSKQSRASAVDDSAAMLRRLERDLHDGAQIRLAALAMNLGMATEKLDADGRTAPPADP